MTSKIDLTTIGVFKEDKTKWVQLCKASGVTSHEKFKQLLNGVVGAGEKEATA